MKTLQVDGGFLRLTLLLTENARLALQQLTLPIGDLVGMDIELQRQLGQRFLGLHRSQRHLGLECRRMRPAASLRYPMLLIRSENLRCRQEENPLNLFSEFAGNALKPTCIALQTTDAQCVLTKSVIVHRLPDI
jgi:hypothetical protein